MFQVQLLSYSVTSTTDHDSNGQPLGHHGLHTAPLALTPKNVDICRAPSHTGGSSSLLHSCEADFQRTGPQHTRSHVCTSLTGARSPQHGKSAGWPFTVRSLVVTSATIHTLSAGPSAAWVCCFTSVWRHALQADACGCQAPGVSIQPKQHKSPMTSV